MNKTAKIQQELEYEEALLMIRKLRKFKKGTAEYKEKQELVKFVTDYEKKNYPYGEDNFEEWFDKERNEKSYKKHLALTSEVDRIIEKKHKFEEDRINEIKKKLKEKNLKQQYLTILFGANKSYVSQLMNRKKNLTLSNISVLHYKLDIPFEKLIPKPELLQKIDVQKS